MLQQLHFWVDTGEPKISETGLSQFRKFVCLFVCLFVLRQSLCHSGWSAVAQSWLTIAPASRVPVILLPQLPR